MALSTASVPAAVGSGPPSARSQVGPRCRPELWCLGVTGAGVCCLGAGDVWLWLCRLQALRVSAGVGGRSGGTPGAEVGRRAQGQGAVSASAPPHPSPKGLGFRRPRAVFVQHVMVVMSGGGWPSHRSLSHQQPCGRRSAWPRIMPGRRTGPRSAGGGRSPDWGAVGGVCDGGAVRAPGCRARHHVPARGAGPSWDRPSAGPGAGAASAWGARAPCWGR